jgi:hypothetical protein
VRVDSGRDSQLTTDVLLMTLEPGKLFHCSNVEYADGLISGRGGQLIAIRIPLYGLDCVLVIMSVVYGLYIRSGRNTRKGTEPTKLRAIGRI